MKGSYVMLVLVSIIAVLIGYIVYFSPSGQKGGSSSVGQATSVATNTGTDSESLAVDADYPETPESVWNAFLDAFNSKDMESTRSATEKYLTESAKTAHYNPGVDCVGVLEVVRFLKSLDSDMPPIEIGFTKPEIIGKTANFTVINKMTNNQPYKVDANCMRIVLVDRDGHWQIDRYEEY